MKIAVRGGHVPLVTGASALINELTEDRKVKDSLIKYLRQLGCDVLDVTPPNNINSIFSNSNNILTYYQINIFIVNIITNIIFIFCY